VFKLRRIFGVEFGSWAMKLKSAIFLEMDDASLGLLGLGFVTAKIKVYGCAGITLL
jgi:hypothetical protein